MTPEQFFKDCEQMTVLMWPIPSLRQKNSLDTSGARLPGHQMLSKLATQVFSHHH
jgi:hypothetical protein